jgi:hypothetical protein
VTVGAGIPARWTVWPTVQPTEELMRPRHTLYAVTAAVGLLAGPAARAGDCPLLTDAAGDGVHKATTLRSPMLDLLSGDLASGHSTVVVALRVASLDLQSEPLRHLDPAWGFAFGLGEGNYGFRLTYDGASDTWLAGLHGPGGPAPVTATVSGDTITWTAPRSAFPELGEPGRETFAELAAISWLAGGNADSMLGAGATYADRSPGCVPAA